MPFYQSPPELANPFLADDVLRRYLKNTLPGDVLPRIEAELTEVGAIAAELHPEAVASYRDEPKLDQWNAWGRRVDQIELTPIWKKAQRITAERGIVATAYEKKSGAFSRLHQFAMVYLIEPSWHVYSCPLAMTDGAAKTLLVSKNQKLIERAVSRLTSRDPSTSWTSGQWMTERTGGSDVAICETIAKKLDDDAYALSGTKWFSSATTSQMALTLGRPEGNPPGGSGLALFYVEVRNPDGTMNGIQVNRLKDKLGTRMVPTAELTLDGARAIPVIGTKDGIKNITPMLNITRTWNAVCAVSGMARGLMLAKDYARRRVAFGAPLSEKSLHLDTLAAMEAEYEGAMMLAFRAVELLGKEECGELSEHEAGLMRLLTPIVKLMTAKQAVAVSSECLEAFGGAGYIEDTGLPRILRDAQVLPIWEGTTNVLSLDLLRALAKGGSLEPIVREVHACVESADVSLKEPAQAALKATEHAGVWLMKTLEAGGPTAVEAGARRLALTLGRTLELALLIKEATRSADKAKPSAAARRLWKHGVDLIVDESMDADARALLA